MVVKVNASRKRRIPIDLLRSGVTQLLFNDEDLKYSKSDEEEPDSKQESNLSLCCSKQEIDSVSLVILGFQGLVKDSASILLTHGGSGARLAYQT